MLVNGGSGFGFGETWHLRSGIAARALDLDDDDGSARSRKAFFIGLVVMPITYLLSMIWAWRRRTRVRAKSTAGISGLFSLWSHCSPHSPQPGSWSGWCPPCSARRWAG